MAPSATLLNISLRNYRTRSAKQVPAIKKTSVPHDSACFMHSLPLILYKKHKLFKQMRSQQGSLHLVVTLDSLISQSSCSSAFSKTMLSITNWSNGSIQLVHPLMNSLSSREMSKSRRLSKTSLLANSYPTKGGTTIGFITTAAVVRRSAKTSTLLMLKKS